MISNAELIIRLVAACVFGAIIGIERERLLWAAGLRTHMLVCVGSCLIIIVSAFGFSDILQTKNVVLDPSRIAAQVVSGIGFLGAGTILFRGEIVRGLTTAASLWAVAAIGLATGAGLYLAAGATTAIVLIVLAGMKPIEEMYRERVQTRVIRLVARRGAFSLDALREVSGDYSRRVKQFVMLQQDEDADTVEIMFVRLPKASADDIVEKLRALPDVSSVEEVSSPGP